MQKNILTIDPGFSGGFAFLSFGRVTVFPMLRDIHARIEFFKSLGNVDTVLIENVGTYRPGNSGPAACTFARHVGNLESEIACLFPGASVHSISPQTWMKAFAGLPKGSTAKEKTARKNFIKAKMERTFPEVKNVTLKTSDALGILYYFQRSCF